jgi:hypothetical protein
MTPERWRQLKQIFQSALSEPRRSAPHFLVKPVTAMQRFVAKLNRFFLLTIKLATPSQQWPHKWLPKYLRMTAKS